MGERTYTTMEAARETGVQYRCLAEWVAQGVLCPTRDEAHRMGNPKHPAFRWSERDLQEAGFVANQRSLKVSLLKIRAALEAWRATGQCPAIPSRQEYLETAALEQAVAVLDREQHRNQGWAIAHGLAYATTTGSTLTAFEAIAIADRYRKLKRGG